jgi:hypothetical protein
MCAEPALWRPLLRSGSAFALWQEELGQQREVLVDLVCAAELEHDNVPVLIASGSLKNKLLMHEVALADLTRALGKLYHRHSTFTFNSFSM